jgi:UDP-N-acetylmuramate--alanine ligase
MAGADPRVAEGRLRELLGARGSRVHFAGIGGVGMAALAFHLRERGLRVSGCDVSEGSITRWLRGLGIDVRAGHDPAHAAEADWLVRSPAVARETPELREALRRGLPVFDRGVVLPRLLDGMTSVAVSGTHGKTTTTAMIAQALRAGGIRAGFCIGGEVPALGGVAGPCGDPYLVVEADESDGTAALYEPDVAVVTNAELDHVDHFADEEAFRRCLARFARNARRRAVVCADDPRCAGLAERALTFGLGPEADVRAAGLALAPLGASFRVVARGADLGEVRLPVPGRHNVLNALAAVAAVLELGAPFEAAAEGLRAFAPARRRFERVGEGRGISVISDYAHHPTEVRALLEQARALGAARIVAVFQPHRYTRTAAFAEAFPPAFEGVEELVLTPVYAASERPVEGGRIGDLHRAFRRRGAPPARLAYSLLDAWARIRKIWRPGDVLLVVGAGDVEQIARWAAADLAGGGRKRRP